MKKTDKELIDSFDLDLYGPLDEPDFYPTEVIDWIKALVKSSTYIHNPVLEKGYIYYASCEFELDFLIRITLEELLKQIAGNIKDKTGIS